MSAADLVIDTAKGYLNTPEGSPKHSDIINRYNQARYSDAYCMTLSDPWCAAFVVACFQAAGLADIIPGYAYCDGMIQIFRQWGRWKNRSGYTPQRGDVIFYDWNGDGSSDHVGIVVSGGSTLTVIEGNKSDTVGYRTISPGSSQIIGYGIPNYTGAAAATSGSAAAPNVLPLDREYIRTLPLLQTGSTGVYVKILQVLLNYYNNSHLVVDGEFGPATKNAVIDYQTRHHLEIDGIVGGETWTQLLLK